MENNDDAADNNNNKYTESVNKYLLTRGRKYNRMRIATWNAIRFRSVTLKCGLWSLKVIYPFL